MRCSLCGVGQRCSFLSGLAQLCHDRLQAMLRHKALRHNQPNLVTSSWPVKGACLQVHASATGLYGYRSTPGVLPSSGVLPVAGDLDSLALVARKPEVLQRLAGALDLPGGELMCDCAPRLLCRSAAALRW